jgi:hypothetical protein
MAIGRIQHRLNKTNYQGAANVDSFFNVNLESEIKLLPPDEIRRLVNVWNIFDNERQSSTRYRVISTLTPIFSNTLFNISGDKGPNNFGNSSGINYNTSYGFQTFDGYIFKNLQFNPDPSVSNTLNYTESVNKHLKEKNGWFGFYNPDINKLGLCNFYDLEPTRERFDMNSSLNVKNWEFTITYPYSSDKQHYLVSGGLLITNAEPINIGGIDMITFGSAVPHNLAIGDTVRLTNMPNILMNGDFTVTSLGLSNGDSKDTFFVVNIDPTNLAIGTLFSTGRMKRLYYGNEVNYYFRKFKKIKSYKTQQQLLDTSYNVYPLAFSQNIYGDQIYQIAFNDDIDVSDLTDNLGRPLSEIFLTMIKTDSSNIFTKVVSGLDLDNYQGNIKTQTTQDRLVSNIRKMHTISPPLAPFQSHIFLEDNVKMNNQDYYGDICEYSKYEVKETVLSHVMHRFNTVDREVTVAKPIAGGTINGPRNEGYIYYPHHSIKIRQFSNYVEQGDTSVINIPSYSEDLGDDRYLWRDFLDIGYNDGQEETIDYPYLNNVHYLYNNLCIYTRRQDPFGYFGLLYTEDFPTDIFGNGLTNKFIVKNSGYVC